MKKFYLSRTLWVNILGAIAMFVQKQYGFVVPPEYQAYALFVVNIILRVITKEELIA